MATTSKTLGVAILACAAGGLLTGSSVRAQPALGLGFGNRPLTPLLTGFNPQAQALGFGATFPQGASLNNITSPYAAFTSNALGNSLAGGAASLYGGANALGSSSYSPYTYYDTNALSETLRGTAAVINAEGMYLKQVQDANYRYEQWQQSRLDTRRKSIEEYIYEQALIPNGEDLRQQTQRYQLRIALHNPPVNEVLSGESLNAIYKDLQVKLASGARGQPLPLDPATLAQINLTSSNGGNLGVLKNVKDGGALRWPLPLQGEAYQEEVRLLNQRAAEAVKLAEFKGQVDAGTISDMTEAVRRLRTKLNANINDLTPSQHIEGNRFLNQLDDAFRALQRPDVADYLGQKYAAQGRTVGDLLDFMSRKGLSFAPAVGGDEGAYQALHSSLVGFAGSLQSQDHKADAAP
jgi:hypothetical protein